MRLFLLLLFAGVVGAQTPPPPQVVVTGSVPYSTSVGYSDVVIINGLPAGCAATATGSIITISGCPGVTVAMSCAGQTVNGLVTLAVPATSQCNTTITNTNNFAVNYSSQNSAVVTVNASGLVSAVGPGTTTVTAQSQQDTTKTSLVTFTVTGPVVITQDASVVAASSGNILIQATNDPTIPGVSANKLSFNTVAQTYDYNVTVTQAGNFTLQARLGTAQGVTGGSVTVHFEAPAGKNISGPLTLGGVNVWSTVASTQPFSAPTGAWTVRLVVDALPTGVTSPAFIHWFQLTPSTVAPAHSVTLNWTAPPPAQPCNQPPQCPLPSGTQPTCFGDPASYNVYRSQTSRSYSTQPLANIQVPTTSYTDTSVVNGQTYYYKVTAYNANACQPESAATNEIAAAVPATSAAKKSKGGKP